MIKPLRIALFTLPLLFLAGCDQVETSTKQLLNIAADSAKQAIDDTQKAATKALDDAKQDLSMAQPKPRDKTEKANQEI